VTSARLLRSRVSWKLSRTVLKPSRSGDAPAQGNQDAHPLRPWRLKLNLVIPMIQ
jgi:hypothetical protein